MVYGSVHVCGIADPSFCRRHAGLLRKKAYFSVRPDNGVHYCNAYVFFPLCPAFAYSAFFQGMGWGIISTSAATLAADNIPKKRFGEGIGYFSLSSSLALAIAPAIALSLHIDVLFILSACFMFLTIVFALILKYNVISFSGACEHFKFRFEKSALIPTCIIFFTNICYGSVVTFLVIYSKSCGIENISSYYLIYAVTLMITRPNIGKLVDKNLHLQVMMLGIFSLISALAVIAFSESIYLFDLGAVFYGIGQGAVLTTSQTLSVINAPEDKIGMASATFAMGFDVGIGFGAIFSGFLVTWFNYSGMFLSLIAAPVLAALIFLSAYKRNAFMLKKA